MNLEIYDIVLLFCSYHHSSSSSTSKPYPYKVLCISSLHAKASDEVVRDTLYREYKRFGDISVKVVQELDERVAYVYFRSYEDARDAKHSKSRIIIFDKPVMVEAAYESSSSSSNNSGYRPQESSRDSFPGPDRHGSGGGSGSYYSRRYISKNIQHLEVSLQAVLIFSAIIPVLWLAQSSFKLICLIKVSQFSGYLCRREIGRASCRERV